MAAAPSLPDLPIICYRNILATASSYAMLAGTDSASSPLSNSWDWDMGSVALPVANSSGMLSFNIFVSGGAAFGMNEMGSPVGFGDVASFGGSSVPDTLIIGSPRHNALMGRFTSGTIRLLFDGVEVINTPINAPNDSSVVYVLNATAMPSVITAEFSGLKPDSTAVIPEIFIGKALAMPGIEYGFYEYSDDFVGSKVIAESGREFRTVRYRTIRQRPRWSNLDAAKVAEVKSFIESTLERLRPFWFGWMPNSRPTEIYMVRHQKSSAPIVIDNSLLKSFTLDLKEAI